MRTISHLLLTAAAGRSRWLSKRAPATGFLLLGAVLPDVPFALLSLTYTLYYRLWPAAPAVADVHRYLHFDLFFTNPLWIVAHNTPHSVIVNGVLFLLGAAGISGKRRWGRPLLWLAAGMMAHTVIDVLTHHSDGPLLFFPLNWTYRFASPISYWEADHFGREFTIFEWTLNGLLVAWFAWRGVRWWKARDHGLVQDRSRNRNRHSGS